jgi:hypothetical protein
MTDTPAKRGRGRPKIVLNMSAILDLAGDGYTNSEIIRALSIPQNVWARRMREEPEFRHMLAKVRVAVKSDILRAQQTQALAGKVGPARMLLELLDKALP